MKTYFLIYQKNGRIKAKTEIMQKQKKTSVFISVIY